MSAESESMDNGSKLMTFEMGKDTARFLRIGFSGLFPITPDGTASIIETAFYKDVYEIIRNNNYVDECGILIVGPPGTGKSMICVYLWKKLKEDDIPFLICPIASLQPDKQEIFLSYVHELEPGFSTTEDQPRKIMEKIIRKEFKDKPRRIFFVDLSGTTKNEHLVNDLVELATLAVSDNWEVIVSTSSGGGWTLHGLSPTHDNIAKVLNSMKLHYQFVESKDFSDEEAKIFIQTFEVGVDKLTNDGLEIGNNPRLMSLFTKTSRSDRRYDMTKYEQRRLMYSDYLRKFAKDLIDLLERREFDTHLRDCLLMLEHARHSVPIPEGLKLDYADSYVAREHLTYVANKDTFEIRMHIPALYDYLIVDLKKRYSKPDSNIRSIPIVQGYMFETAFLSSKLLRDNPLTIQAVNSDQPASPRTFQFPSLNPCGSQLLGALTTNLEENYVYHLRNRHPAIDGVCVTCIDAKKYLLLLQVSLSPYKDHVSKGNDIKQCIPSKEGGMGTRKTIAEYYQHLGGDIPNDQVIYVYVSPEETRSPNDVIFNHELNVSDTRSGRGSQQKFWYGFLDSVMERLMKQIVDSIGL